MLSDEKILITGPAGQIAFPLTQFLARDNEVWGIARFSEAGSRERVDALGVTTHVVDLAEGDYSDVPDDFTYVLHLATFQATGLDFDWALKVNAEGTGGHRYYSLRSSSKSAYEHGTKPPAAGDRAILARAGQVTVSGELHFRAPGNLFLDVRARP